MAKSHSAIPIESTLSSALVKSQARICVASSTLLKTRIASLNVEGQNNNVMQYKFQDTEEIN